MRIVGISGTAISAPAMRRKGDLRDPELAETKTRALIAIEATAPSERQTFTSRYPSAAFLAHLIATHQQAPQTRVRRRAEPAEAIAAYQAGKNSNGQAGHVFRALA